MAEQVYEVLSRTPLGHETVTRVRAASKAAAVEAAVQRGLPRQEIVSTTGEG